MRHTGSLFIATNVNIVGVRGGKIVAEVRSRKEIRERVCVWASGTQDSSVCLLTRTNMFTLESTRKFGKALRKQWCCCPGLKWGKVVLFGVGPCGAW